MDNFNQNTRALRATSFPLIDPFDPFTEQLREDFHLRLGVDDEEPAYEARAFTTFMIGYRAPWIGSLVADLQTGRWGIGTTRQDLTDAIGFEIGIEWVTNARNSGIITAEALMMLLTLPTRPVDWEPDLELLRPLMLRSGFMAVATMLGGLQQEATGVEPEPLNEFRHELICDMFHRPGVWNTILARGSEQAIRQRIRGVQREFSSSLIPAWNNASIQKKKRKNLLDVLDEKKCCISWVFKLRNDWLAVYTETATLLPASDMFRED
jgi:hypothetical protein